MVKEKKILSYVLGWLILGYIICFIGINNVFAANYTGDNFDAQLFDNLSGTLNYIDTYTEIIDNKIGYYYGFISKLVANSAGGAWGFSSPIPIVNNHTYSLSVKTQVIGCGYTNISSINRIGIGLNFGDAKYSYESNVYVEEIYSKSLGTDILQFVFKANKNASFIIIPFSTSSTCNNATVQLYSISIEDLGESSISQSEINNSLNNQTNEINSSIQNSTDTITGEIDDMEQNIIDSNKETQDVIKDQFNTCYTNLFKGQFNQTNIIGQPIDLRLFAPDNYYIEAGKTYTFSTNVNLDGIMYGINLSTVPHPTSTDNRVFDSGWQKGSVYTFTPNVSGYFGVLLAKNDPTQQLLLSEIEGNWFMLVEGPTAKPYSPYGEEICSNKIDETNDKLDNLQGAITDSSSPNTGALENSAGWLPAGPLDSILNLPLTMLNSLTNSLGKTCYPLNLTLPYVNKNIQIPCLSAIFAQITGVNGLWTWVGTIASVLILYNYLLNLYAWVDRVLTLRAEFDEAMGADLANWGRL